MSEAGDLVRLQDIDLRLMRHAAKLHAMPQQKRLDRIAEARRRVAGELTKVKGQRKDVEMEIADLEARHAELDEKVAEVRATADERVQNYRAVNDLEAQLTSLAKRTEKVEFELVAKEELLDRLRASEADGARISTRLAEEDRACRASFAEDTAHVREEVRALAEERKAIVASLSPELAERYDRARRRFDGLAVETLHGNVPTICRVKLQPGQFQKLAKGPVIAECPYCHRILVTEEVSDE